MTNLEEKLNQLYEQGIVKESASKRLLQLEQIRSSIPRMKTDKRLNDLLKLFKALGNKNRLLIIWLIMKGVRCACEIEDLLNLSQSTVSHHINALVDVGAINAIKKGKWNLVKTEEISLNLQLFVNLLKDILE